MSVRNVKMVSMELEDMMATGTIGGGISVCAVEPYGLYCASNVGWDGAIGRTCGTHGT